MKIRDGFVSNSSSTSFGVSHDPAAPLKVVVDLSQYVTETFRTVDELDEFFEDRYGSKGGKYHQQEDQEMVALIQGGKAISILSIDRDSYGLLDSILGDAEQEHQPGAPTLCWCQDG